MDRIKRGSLRGARVGLTLGVGETLGLAVGE